MRVQLIMGGISYDLGPGLPVGSFADSSVRLAEAVTGPGNWVEVNGQRYANFTRILHPDGSITIAVYPGPSVEERLAALERRLAVAEAELGQRDAGGTLWGFPVVEDASVEPGTMKLGPSLWANPAYRVAGDRLVHLKDGEQ